ncbi:autophagy-related protein 16-like [Watersipora subatra]|uniref:autophagy-related protein 16-like n=1 Tax=Watersipora subatra TaxID=2589382 RepID=UPI00355C3414
MDLQSYLLAEVQRRNCREREDGLSKIITSNARLLKSVLELKKQCRELESTEDTLRLENVTLRQKTSLSGASEEQLQQHIKVQEELTGLLRERGEKNQEIIDLKNKIQDYEKQLSIKEAAILGKDNEVSAAQAKVEQLEGRVEELSATNQMLKDEQQALQLEYICMSDKYKVTEQQYNDLIERWLERTQQDADQQNKEMEEFQRQKQNKIQKQIKEAMKAEPKVLVKMPQASYYSTASVPTKVLYSFEAHDGEINDIKWSPSGRVFATAGVDRKVKIWEVSANQRCQKRGTLAGSNGGVMSIEFDSEPENSLLAGSNDFACHIWNINDQRHRHALTGHSGRVFCAKFMENAGMVVSGSHDRTLKQWDLRERACVRTMFAGSSCNALVTVGSLVVSGHFDKKVRFWDKRTDSQSNEITLQAKVTSLELATDRNRLLCSTREPSLKIIDIRMNQVVSTFMASSFNIGADYAKATFSPDMEYVCCGSSDGSIYIWNVNKGRVEKVLEKEHTHTVIACSWHPAGNYLISCDNKKKVVLWSDF